jgi:hypothetical protein
MFSTKGCGKFTYCLLTDRILNVKIMLGHVHIRVTYDALDRGQIDPQSLKLGDVSVSTAVRG